MAATADELRMEIEQRRTDISRDLDMLGDKVSPSRIAQRRTEKITGGARKLRENVMGTFDSASSSVTSSVGSATGTVSDKAQHAPEVARRQVEGNPLGAGLVAFGFGLVAAALIPSTQKEEQLARQAEPMLRSAMEGAQETGREIVADLREPAQHAAEEVKSAATGAAQEVRSTATDAAGEVRSTASH